MTHSFEWEIHGVVYTVNYTTDFFRRGIEIRDVEKKKCLRQAYQIPEPPT